VRRIGARVDAPHEEGGSGSPANGEVRFWLEFGLHFTRFRASATPGTYRGVSHGEKGTGGGGRRRRRIRASKAHRGWCSAHGAGLQVSISTLRARGGWGSAHRGMKRAVRPCGGCRRQGQAAARTGCSRTARRSAPPGLLVHPIDAHGSCEGAKRVSLAGGLPAATNCPERLMAYRKLSGRTGQCRGGLGRLVCRGGWERARGAAAAKKRGVGSLGVRIARQRMPRIPRLVAAQPNPSAGNLLEGKEGSVLASGALRARGREPRGAAERPTVDGRADGPARGKTEEGARGKKRLTGGTGLAEGERRESGRERLLAGGEGLARAGPWREREGEGEAWGWETGPGCGPRGERRGRGARERERGREEWAGLRGLGLVSFPLLFFFPFPHSKHSNHSI
jgi:hypothetical protein